MAVLDASQLASLTAANAVVSAASFLGSFFIVASYLGIAELRKPAFRLIFWLSLSELFYSVGNFMGDPEQGTGACYLQAVVLSFCETAAVLWTSVIARSLHLAVHKPHSIDHWTSTTRYHCFAWGVSFVLTLLPALTHSYGSAGPFCWIKGTSIGLYWRFVQFYLPLWLCMGYNLSVYYRAARIIQHRLQRAGGSIGRSRMPLLLYPMILFVCWFWASVNRVQNWVAPDAPQYWLFMLQVTFGGCQGLLHALAYGFTESVQREVRSRLPCEGLRRGRHGAHGDSHAHHHSLGLGGGASGMDDGTGAQHSVDPEGDTAGLTASHKHDMALAPAADAKAAGATGAAASAGAGGGDESGDDDDGTGGDADAARAAAAPAAARPRSHTSSGKLERLVDVSHQIRAAYLATVGVYELVGLQPTADTIADLGRRASLTGPDGAGDGAIAGDHAHAQAPVVAAKVGLASTYLTLGKSFVGIGILAIPHAFMQAGFVGASLGIVVVAFVSYYCMLLIIKTQDMLEATGRTEPGREVSLATLARATVGPWGAALADFAILSSQAGFSAAYLLFIGDNVSQPLRKRGMADVDKTLVVCLAALAVVPLAWLRSLKKLAPAAIAADVVILFGLVVVLVNDLNHMAAADADGSVIDPVSRAAENSGGGGGGGGGGGEHVAPFKLSTLPLFFGVAVFAFEGAGMILPIRQAMAQPAAFPSVLRNTIVALVVLLNVFGTLGYIAFGEAVSDMITLDMPTTDVVLAVQLLYCLGLFFTFPIMMVPVFTVVEGSRAYANMLSGVSAEPKRLATRTALVAAVTLTAVLTPHFGLFVNLIGAGSCTLIAFVLPLILYSAVAGDSISRRRRWLHTAMLVFGVGGGILSFTLTMVELVTLPPDEE